MIREVAAAATASVLAAAGLVVAGAAAAAPGQSTTRAAAPSRPPVNWCRQGFVDPYSKPPRGATVIPAGDNGNGPFSHSWTLQPDTTYWFAPGVHTLGKGEYATIGVAAGDRFVGAPGAIIDGENDNNYAFESGVATNPLKTKDDAVIEYLTIKGFLAGDGEQVVGQGGYDGWTIRHDTVEDNPYGAGVALATNSTVVDNCLQHNGEYGYSSIGGATHVVLAGNDVYDNNDAGYYDVSGSKVQCGCSGGGKFWQTTGATVSGNYIHDNIGVGIWVDTDNAGVDIAGNYISGNWGEAITYEISYNGQILDNTLVGNSYGNVTNNESPDFPAASVYISESGNKSTVASSFSKGPFLIAGNVLTDNWGGIVLYQNADRVCGFSSDGTCTLPHRSAFTLSSCKAHLENASHAEAVAETPDYYDKCRWKTEDVTVEDNTIDFDSAALTAGPFAGKQTCEQANAGNTTLCGYDGLFSTYSSIKPYEGAWEPLAISDQQGDVFRDNTYTGPIGFVGFSQGERVTWAQWTKGFTDPYSGDHFDPQDAGSTYSA